jgi:hypothetical protein
MGRIVTHGPDEGEQEKDPSDDGPHVHLFILAQHRLKFLETLHPEGQIRGSPGDGLIAVPVGGDPSELIVDIGFAEKVSFSD